MSRDREGSVANERTATSQLISPKGHHRIDSRRAARRKITGQCGDGREDDQHAGERCGITRGHAEKEPAQRSRQGPRGGGAQHYPNGSEAESLQDDACL